MRVAGGILEIVRETLRAGDRACVIAKN